jgi:hypothetical protein
MNEEAGQADERYRVPVLPTDEHCRQFSRPLVSHIFHLADLRMKGALEVVTELVIEDRRKKEIPHEWNQLRGERYSLKHSIDE